MIFALFFLRVIKTKQKRSIDGLFCTRANSQCRKCLLLTLHHISLCIHFATTKTKHNLFGVFTLAWLGYHRYLFRGIDCLSFFFVHQVIGYNLIDQNTPRIFGMRTVCNMHLFLLYRNLQSMRNIDATV